MMPRCNRQIAGLLAGVACILGSRTLAQTNIAPSNGAGSTGTTVTRTGGTYTIDGGTRSGPNLFHSFETFNLGASRTAAWVQTIGDAASIRAVVNRVTGGGASTIAGTINSTALPNASFYFINPAGIVFTAGARVSVGQNAHFSTADAVRFADGRSFTITTASGSVLSADAPSAFGFLGSQGAITMTGIRSGNTSFSGLDLSASHIEINDTIVNTSALGLFAVGTSTTNLAIGEPADRAALTGNITATDSVFTVRPDKTGDGRVTVGADRISFSDGRILAQPTAARDGGNVNLLSGDLTLTDFLFGSRSQTEFSAGDVVIDAGAVRLIGTSGFQAFTLAPGDAGDILVRAGSIDIAGDSGIVAVGGPGSSGDAGQVKLVIDGLLALHDYATIGSRINFDATGDAGNVEIDAGSMSIVGVARTPNDRAEVTSSTRGGAGGNVTINVTGTLAMGPSSDIRSAANSGSTGNAGNVTINAGRLNLLDSTSRITSATDSAGNAGVVTVSAGTLAMTNGEISSATSTNGLAGVVDVSATTLDMANGAISSSTTAAGSAGVVNVRAGALTMNGGQILSSTSAAGRAGVVNVVADIATLNNGSINSSTSGPGDAGVVNVTATDTLNMTRGQINSTTTGVGNAGMVNVRANILDMRNAAVISASAKSGSRGNAGKVTVAADTRLDMQGSSVISSRTEANTQGDAGDITITAGQLTMSGRAGSSDQRARITTSTQSGAGGNVNITVAGLMSQVANAEVLAGADGAATAAGGTVIIKARELQLLATTTRIGTSTTSQSANAGASSIDVGTLLLDGGRLSSTTTGAGDAGAIAVKADSMTMRGASVVTASTLSGSSGDAGRVVLNVGTLDMRDTAEITSRTEFNTLGNAGDIDITANAISMVGVANAPNNRTEITSSTRAGSGGQVRITVADTLSMGVSSDIRAAANPGSTGDAGTVTIRAGRLELLSATSRVTSSTQSSGDAGGVAVNVAALMVDGGEISSNSARGTPDQSDLGNAGSIDIVANGAIVRNGGQITTSTEGSGRGGAISITARDNIDVLADGRITSASLAGSTGNAGTVTIQGDAVNILGPGVAFQASATNGVGGGTVSSSTASDGLAGTVTLQGGQVTVAGNVTSATTAGGNAGSVVIKAASLLVDGGAVSSDVALATATGTGGTVFIEAPQVAVTNAGSISSSTVAATDAGTIRIDSDTLALGSGGSVQSSTSAAGNAGSVTIVSGNVHVPHGTAIRTSSTGSGRAGAISLASARTRVDGGIITSSAESSEVGTSGSIVVGASSELDLTQGGVIETTSANASPAGTLLLTGGAILIDGQGTRVATENSSASPGSAGSIRIAGGPITISNGGIVTSNSVAGPAGDISLAMPGNSLLTLSGARFPGIITTSSGPLTGGRITITNPLAIISNGGSILAQGQEGGANVQISTRYFIRSSDRANLLTVDGLLTLNTLQNDVSSGTVSDSLSFLDASKVLRGQCAAASSRDASVMRVSPLSPSVVVGQTTPALAMAAQAGDLASCL